MDKAKSKDREKTLRAAGVKTHSTFGRVTESVAAGFSAGKRRRPGGNCTTFLKCSEKPVNLESSIQQKYL